MKTGFLSNLARRVATAAIALPLLGLALFRGPAWLIPAIVAAAVLVGLLELRSLVAARGMRMDALAAVLVAGVTFVEVLAPPAGQGIPLWPLVIVIVLAALVFRRAPLGDRIPGTAIALLGGAYLGALAGTMAALRTMVPPGDGAWRLTLLLAVIMIADTFAYFVGHAIGRHRLAPALSPGKTVEGGLGALVGGLLAAVGVCHMGLPTVPATHAALLGLAVAAVGTVGDLAESLLKRWAGVKDSGALFPGHGGMLDRLDSLLFGAPVLYYYFLLR